MSPRKYLQLVLMNATISGRRCTEYFCVKQTGAIIQKKTFHQLCKKNESQYKTTITVTSPLSRRRQGRSFCEAQGCEGNRKRQTPAPWEHEDYTQLARHPPPREEAPGWEKWMGKWGVSSEIKKIIFCYTGLKSQNILEDVGEGGGTLPTSQEDS